MFPRIPFIDKWFCPVLFYLSLDLRLCTFNIYIYTFKFTLYCWEFPVLSLHPVPLLCWSWWSCWYQGEMANFGLKAILFVVLLAYKWWHTVRDRKKKSYCEDRDSESNDEGSLNMYLMMQVYGCGYEKLCQQPMALHLCSSNSIYLAFQSNKKKFSRPLSSLVSI